MSQSEMITPALTHSPTDQASPCSTGLQQEFHWLTECIEYRLEQYFKMDSPTAGVLPAPPELGKFADPFGLFLQQQALSISERLLLILALAPPLQPNALDIFLTKNPLYDRVYSEFGGVFHDQHSHFQPTLQTACFLLAGKDVTQKLTLLRLFSPQHALFIQGWLQFEQAENTAHSNLLCPLRPTPVFLERHILGNADFSLSYKEFPAVPLTTEKAWDDLILSVKTHNQLRELQAWLQYGEALLQAEGTKHFKPGYRCLFYGPPGTGKTLTASLLGKLSQQTVYRIDLSQLVSKYIGETEKNLERLFSLSERNHWILFFDEADALFGKRTQVSSSNDRYANQETAYLLQRIEDCPNVVILASNLKDNFDDAFMRRFQSCIYFPLPGCDERLKLWQQGLIGRQLFQAPDFDLQELAQRFELSGGTISNVLRYASLMALQEQRQHFSLLDIHEGIRRELDKEGKSL